MNNQDRDLQKELKELGYARIAGFVPAAEVDALEAACDEVVAWQEQNPSRMPEVNRPGEMTFVNELVAEPEHAERVREFGVGSRVAGVAQAILGREARHYLWQIVYKHGGYADPFCWHQDHLHTPADRNFFNIWIALSDMTVENGCLWVMPEVSLDTLRSYEQTPFGRTCWPLDDPNQGLPMEMKRGDALIVTSYTLHKSSGNFTDQMRKAVLFAFMRSGAVADGKPVPLHGYDTADAERC